MILKLFIALIVLTSVFLFYGVLSYLSWGLSGSTEGIVGGMVLLISVALFVPVVFWTVFADERKENSKKAAFAAALILGSIVFFVSFVLEAFGAATLHHSTPIIAFFFLPISPILGLAGILAVILTLDDHFAAADLKDEIDRRRLPTAESP
jgi:hypothetical protein